MKVDQHAIRFVGWNNKRRDDADGHSGNGGEFDIRRVDSPSRVG
jgi:hypothetical protein